MKHAAPGGGRSVAAWMTLFAALAAPPAGADTPWTLAAGIARALEVAPEVAARDAAFEAQAAAAGSAGLWPNPEIEIRGDNRLSRERDERGHDLTGLAVSQPLAFGLTSARRAIADRTLEVRRAEARVERLDLEHRVARAYLRLQRNQALLRAAEEAAATLERLRAQEERRLALGELSRREALRMTLLASQAEAAVADAAEAWAEARLDFAALLSVDPEAVGKLAALTPPDQPPRLSRLQAALADHPFLEESRARAATHEAGLDLARAEGGPAFRVTLYRERDVFNGRTDAVYGGALNVTVPLWDRRQGRRGELRALALGERYRQQAIHRRLETALQSFHGQLLRRLEQMREQQDSILTPARELREMTRRGYRLGEADLTSLIEIHELARAAGVRQQELQAEALFALADLLHAAGLPMAAALSGDPREEAPR